MSVKIDISSLETRLFINNEFVDSASGQTFDTVNPATEEVICSVQEANEEDVEKAATAACNAFDRESKWRKMPAYERGMLMYKLADLLEEKMDFFASLSSMDNGKPAALDGKKYGSKYDMQMTVRVFRYYAGWADKISGRTIPAQDEHFAFTVKEPVGVCGLIIPWNFPLVTLSWKLAPALATGCTAIIKSSEKTPLCALQFGKLIKEAGFPPGVVNILNGPGSTVGKAMATHPHIAKISFTGSTAVGKMIQKYAAEKNLKRITLELGGKSPVIVLDDAPIEHAVKLSLQAIYQNQGECCTAGTRLYIQESIYEEFTKKFVEETKKLKLSHGFDSEADLGPIVDKTQFDKILEYIKKGKEEGAELLCGGGRQGDKGYYIQPTVFAKVTEDMTIGREEIFGPVQCLFKFKTLKEVIKRANDNEYGLAAGVISRDIGRTMMLATHIAAGTVWVNTFNMFDVTCPFGGYKESGVGREKGSETLDHYMETKTIMFPLDRCD